MVFLPSTPLMINYYISRVTERSLSRGYQPSKLEKVPIYQLEFFYWNNLHGLSLPRSIGRFIREIISIYKFLIIN
jgi:hypothetical protein